MLSLLAVSLLTQPGSSLVKLDLSDNPLTEEVAGELAACLEKQPQLRHLNLNDTGLLDEGVEAICKALAGAAAPELESLELALNEITPAGTRYVVMAVANKQKLSK
jgi:large subunit ribosomal protein L31/Ran GTPase-activating protein 1